MLMVSAVDEIDSKDQETLTYLQKAKQDSAHNNMQASGVDYPVHLYVTAFVVIRSIE